MIGQRYAGTRAVTTRDSKWRLPASPATAGRERLAHALGESMLVQLTLAMVLVVIAALLYLSQASQADILQLRIDILQQQSAQLNAQNASLHATATQLQSLQRIDSTATNQLHMTKPDLSQTLWVTVNLTHLPPAAAPDADLRAAELGSQPVARMQQFISTVLASL